MSAPVLKLCAPAYQVTLSTNWNRRSSGYFGRGRKLGMPISIPPVTVVPGPAVAFGSCCSKSRPICTRASFSQRSESTVFTVARAKSVLTLSVPFADGATEMTGCVWTPLGESQRCMLYCRVMLLRFDIA